MSITVTISGDKSELESYFHPPLNLSGKYECGLLYFSITNSKSFGQFSNNTAPVIGIECDLIYGSYTNGIPTHTIYELVSDTAGDIRYIETPQNIVYLPVYKNIVSSISIKVVNQFGQSLNNIGHIQLRLHLRKIK